MKQFHDASCAKIAARSDPPHFLLLLSRAVNKLDTANQTWIQTQFYLISFGSLFGSKLVLNLRIGNRLDIYDPVLVCLCMALACAWACQLVKKIRVLKHTLLLLISGFGCGAGSPISPCCSCKEEI